MNTRLKLFLTLIIVGSVGIVGFYFARPHIIKGGQLITSDSGRAQGIVTIGIDNWVGYIPLCGRELRKRLHNSGILLQCQDDNADYPGRMKKFHAGNLDFAVATVDSYILNGAREEFPGTIVAVIDESKGGDAIIGRKDHISRIEELKIKSSYKIAFTPSSPSEHLLKSISSHFDIPALRDKRGSWRVEVNGSQDARKQLESGKVDAAVLWEPDVSRVLEDTRFVKLLGTEDTRKLIVDILVVNREYAKKYPDRAKTVLSQYFHTLKAYRDQPDLLLEEIQSATKLSSQKSSALLKGVRWFNLTENARDWFGIAIDGQSRENLVETIDSTVEILLDHKDFPTNPLPDHDPYRLQYRYFVEELLKEISQFGSTGEASLSTEKKFATLTLDQWETLTEVGTLRVRPITFQSGTSDLSAEGKEEINQVVSNLDHYPNFRVLIKGHTGVRGDLEANRALSLSRAESVRNYILELHKTDPNQLRAVGLGSDHPLLRDPGEGDRAYEYRLPRVELTLVSEAF